MAVETPSWVHHAVFYQIFPDRFARSGRVRHQNWVDLKRWGTPPEEQGFQGGDLYGIVDRLDYLSDLGVTALYLNPIFTSAANHRYHTYDYYEVDPLLGGNDALRELLDAAHGRDIRVVLDGVFNHASRGFWAFHHILENGGNSPYVDWFNVRDWPLNPYPSDAETDHNYDAWADLPALPEFNTDHPEVRRFLLDVAAHWLKFGIDGWRLDVPQEIDDAAFWRDFRDVVKSVNPDAYITGEIWHEAPEWLQGDRFDALMNYPFLGPTLSFFGADSLRDYGKAHLTFEPLDAPDFADDIARILDLYPWTVTLAQLNLLDSHDMARALWIVGDDVTALRQAVLFQMTIPGAPCIYYGDEVGLSAPGDPYCREAFPWNDPAMWDEALLAFYRDATALRHAHEVLRIGQFETLHAEDRVLAFRRFLDGSTQRHEALVVFNAGADDATLTLNPDDFGVSTLRSVWPPPNDEPNGNAVELTLNGTPAAVTVPARDARVWVGDRAS